MRVIDEIDVPEPGDMAGLLQDRPNLREQFDEAKESAELAVKAAAETLKYDVGEAHAQEALSQWEGFD